MADLKGQEIRNAYDELLTKGAGNTVEDGDGAAFDIFDRAFTAGGLVRFPSGINFNASGGDTLSEYEVGTFTPILTAFTTDFTSVTYTLQYGIYTLIGNRCYFDARINTSAVDKTAGAGSVSVQGFPFVTLNSANYRAVAEVNLRGGFVNRPNGAAAFPNFNGFTLYRDDSALQPSDISTGINTLVLSGSYLID